MLDNRIRYYRSKLKNGELCCVKTKQDVEALSEAVRHNKNNFDIKTIIFQTKGKQKYDNRYN